MSSRFEPTSQQTRSIPFLGYHEVSAPHAGLFNQPAPVGSDQIRSGPGGGPGGTGGDDLVALAATVLAAWRMCLAATTAAAAVEATRVLALIPY
jgi:hypothetical protein